MEKIKRSSGVLLSISSLPNKYSLGTFSVDAFKFIDLLSTAGFGVWQVLPISDCGLGKSPYSCRSSFAINPTLVNYAEFFSFSEMERFGFNKSDSIEAQENRIFTCLNVAYDRIKLGKNLSEVAMRYCLNFDGTESLDEGQLKTLREIFCDSDTASSFYSSNAYWLDDYALYTVIKKENGGKSWKDWEQAGLRDKKPEAIKQFADTHAEQIDRIKWIQMVAFLQWQAIKKYANTKGVKIFGDVPYYVDYDCADVWSNRTNWKLSASGKGEVAGVPPDYFNQFGQRWGNPIYNFATMKKNGYKYFVDRLKRASALMDIARIDHFIAFARYYSILESETTALNGKWVKGVGDDLLQAILQNVDISIVAEDLGIVTDEVIALREKFEIPGLKVLQFAFDDYGDNIYQPHNYEKNTVAYIGTHDNDTFMGLLNHSDWDKINRFKEYLRIPLEWGNDAVVDNAIITLYRSSANLVVFTMQDLLKLDSNARMNTPGTTTGNWCWQLDQIPDIDTNYFHTLSRLYGRLPKTD